MQTHQLFENDTMVQQEDKRTNSDFIARIKKNQALFNLKGDNLENYDFQQKNCTKRVNRTFSSKPRFTFLLLYVDI